MSALKIKFPWQEGKDDEHIILFTRCRIARNLPDLPFHHRYCNPAQKKKLSDTLSPYFLKKKFYRIMVARLSPPELQYCLDNKIITREITQNAAGQCFYLARSGLSVLVGEEDHLRIQSLAAGFALRDTVKAAFTLEQDLQEQFSFAFREPFGFLTACPTNTGTGTRLSVILHLRALYMLEKHSDVLEGIKKLGMDIRGLGGEGTTPEGPMLQISNRVTLGMSEWDIMEKFERAILSIRDREREARKLINEKNPVKLRDMISRSAAILQSAWLMDYEESLNHLSLYYLGLALKIIRFEPAQGLGYFITRLTFASLAGAQTGTKKKQNGKPEAPDKQNHLLEKELVDQKRAATLRKILKAG